MLWGGKKESIAWFTPHRQLLSSFVSPQLSRKTQNMQQGDQEKLAQDSQKVHDLLGGLRASQRQ
jgi:hypothetical protein